MHNSRSKVVSVTGKSRLNRVLDLCFAGTACAVSLPAIMLLMLLIKCESPGPAIFRQIRSGRFGRPFLIYKLRTMADDPGTPQSSGRKRVTTIGRFLRASKLDELPQLFNVLRGEMSLVGPRPELPELVRLYDDADRVLILSLAPGMTDFASIRFRHEGRLLATQPDPDRFYVDVIMPAKLRYCRLYVARASVATDLAIIARTVLALSGDLVELLRQSLGRKNDRVPSLFGMRRREEV